MCWFEIIAGGIVEGLVITISYLIIEYLRKRRITAGGHCPFCHNNIKTEVKRNSKKCDFCSRKLRYSKKTKKRLSNNLK